MPAKKFFTTEARVTPGSPRERRMIIAAALTADVENRGPRFYFNGWFFFKWNGISAIGLSL